MPAADPDAAAAPDTWNELIWPREYPLALLRDVASSCRTSCKEGRGKLDIYFTRVYNPVWTNPDGFRGSRC